MTPETVAAVQQAISQVGFPVFVAVYMMIYFRQTIDKNTESNIKLYDKIEKLLEERSK